MLASGVTVQWLEQRLLVRTRGARARAFSRICLTAGAVPARGLYFKWLILS